MLAIELLWSLDEARKVRLLHSPAKRVAKNSILHIESVQSSLTSLSNCVTRSIGWTPISDCLPKDATRVERMFERLLNQRKVDTCSNLKININKSATKDNRKTKENSIQYWQHLSELPRPNGSIASGRSIGSSLIRSQVS